MINNSNDMQKLQEAVEAAKIIQQAKRAHWLADPKNHNEHGSPGFPPLEAEYWEDYKYDRN